MTRVWDFGFQIWVGFGFWSLDFGVWILVLGCGFLISDVGFRILVLGSSFHCNLQVLGRDLGNLGRFCFQVGFILDLAFDLQNAMNGRFL